MIACCKFSHTAQYIPCRVLHRHGRPAIIDGSVAQLAIKVIAPAIHGSGGSQRTSVTHTRRQRGHATGQPVHVDRRSAIDVGTIAQLTTCIGAPALHSPGGGHRASAFKPHPQRRHATHSIPR
ncbi:hypothetical protein SDC9_90360 [bioreactor metagenome]|uniref:Uncharacterized protein n=1 Tax=bioreactor metagenome TaxID=1076179 RepID=A0A644ZYI4_9ZZZZ